MTTKTLENRAHATLPTQITQGTLKGILQPKLIQETSYPTPFPLYLLHTQPTCHPPDLLVPIYIESSSNALFAHFKLEYRLLLFFPFLAVAVAVVVAAAAVAFAVADEVATAAAAFPPTFSTTRVWTGAALDVTVRPRSAKMCQ
jgi:hypothetical protein